MFNVYVHLDVLGLPDGVLDHDDFLEALWRELPDAGLGGRDDLVTITLSQFALGSRTAARRQIGREARSGRARVARRDGAPGRGCPGGSRGRPALRGRRDQLAANALIAQIGRRGPSRGLRGFRR